MKKFIVILAVAPFLLPAPALAQEPVCTAPGGPSKWQVVDTTVNRMGVAVVTTSGGTLLLGGNDGAGETSVVEIADRQFTSKTATAELPGRYAYAAATSNDKFVYSIGGLSDAVSTKDVNMAGLVNGLPDKWSKAESLREARYGAASLIIGDYIYAFGGGTYTAERARINPDGSLSAWEFAAPIPAQWTHLGAVRYGDYAYLAGGPTNGVSYAPINPDGSLGDWLDARSSDGQVKNGRPVAYNGYLYLVGDSQVQRARINPDGSLTRWEFLNAPLNVPRRLAGVFLQDRYVYVVGGTANDVDPVGAVERWDISRPVIPVDFGVTINDGALFANQVTTTLTIGQPAWWDKLVQVSNDGGFAGAIWQTYSPCQGWTITQYGSYIIPRTVYVRFKDPSSGQLSPTFQDDIILDMTAPTGSIDVVNGVQPASAAATAPAGLLTAAETAPADGHSIYLPLITTYSPPPNVTIRLAAIDDVSGVGYMMVSNSADFTGAAWEPYRAIKPWNVPKGKTTVYVRLRDWAGNVSAVLKDTITR